MTTTKTLTAAELALFDLDIAALSTDEVLSLTPFDRDYAREHFTVEVFTDHVNITGPFPEGMVQS